MPPNDVKTQMAVAQIKTVWPGLGAKVPATLLERLDEDQAATSLDKVNPGALRDATAQALLDGRDPAADPDILALLARNQLARDLGTGFAESLRAKAVHSALVDHAAELFDNLAAAVNELAERIYKAQETWPNTHYGDLDPSRPEISPDKAAILSAARQAETHLATIGRTWRTLASAVGYPHLSSKKDATHPTALLFASLSHAELEEVRVTRQDTGSQKPLADTDVVDVIRARHRLDLATPARFEERCQRVAEERKAHNAARPSFRDTFRAAQGTGGMAVRIR